MFSKNGLVLFLAVSTVCHDGVSARENIRKTQTKSQHKMEWPECPTNGWTAQQCKEHIENQVKAHVIPDIQVEIIYPREPEVMDDSYWKVGIQTNHLGKVVGQSIDGLIRWPGVWEGTDPELGFREVGDWKCGNYGNAMQCCDVIQADVPDEDVKGNYLECYVSQDDPAPYVKDESTHGYCSWVWDNTAKKFNPVDVTFEELEEADAFMKSELAKNIVHLTAYLRDGVAPYDRLAIVNNSCHLYGRAVPSLQSLCNDMDKVMHPPNMPGTDVEINLYLEEVLTNLKAAIEEYVVLPYTVEHKVAVYAGDAAGSYVDGNPAIGGKPNGPVCVPP